MLAVEVPRFREIASWSSLVVELDRVADLRRGADDFVQKMHTENGLWADLENTIATARGPAGIDPSKLPRYFDVQQRAREFYIQHAGPGQRVYLCGANPDFDRRWLEAKMPVLAKGFGYRNFDTNAFFILREYLFGSEKSGQKHRVLDDCRQAVAAVHEHFALMKELFGPKAAGPKAAEP